MFKRCIVTIILCLLTACSSNSSNSKQILRLNLYTEPPTLDSRKATDSTSMNVLMNLFEGLTRIGDDYLPQPGLAESIVVSPDKLTYIFTLREAYWTNGDKITANDFVYTWKKMLDPTFPAPFADKLYCIKNAAAIKEGKLPLAMLGVEAVNPSTLVVTLDHPAPYFLELTAFPTLYPINPRIDQKNPEWAAEAGPDYVTNGPFQLKSWEHESELVMEKSRSYWDKDEVKLQEIRMVMIDDTTTEFYMFEMNELDWAGSPLSTLPPEFIAALKEADNQEHMIYFYPATAVYYYKFNTNYPQLNNTNIRKALAYAINRKEIVEHISQAGQQPATALVPNLPGWSKQSLFKDNDTELAKQLFEKGLEELNINLKDFPKLTLTYNTSREHQKIAQAIQQQWKETFGIELELLVFDWKVYLSKISNQDFQVCRMGWVGDYQDPVSFLEPFKFKNIPGAGGNNDTGWEHPEYINYMDLAAKETNYAKRFEYLQKAEEILISEMPIVPIYFVVNGYLKKPYVEGVHLSPLGAGDFKRAYINK